MAAVKGIVNGVWHGRRWWLTLLGLIFLPGCQADAGQLPTVAVTAEPVVLIPTRPPAPAPPPTWTPAPAATDEPATLAPLASRTATPPSSPWPTATPSATATQVPTETATETAMPAATHTPWPQTTAMPTATLTAPASSGANLLPNPSFEEGWYHWQGLPELQVPDRWLLEWEAGPNPFDPDPWNAFVRPESRVLPAQFLPPAEHATFIWHGRHTVKIFKGQGAISFRLLTDVQLEPGSYVLEINVFPDLVVDYTANGSKVWAPDPLSGEVRLVVDGGGSGWMLPAFGRKNTFYHTFQVDQARQVRVGVAIRGRWAILNNGWFMDDWSLRRTE
jgi:hypothetical protein